MSKQQKNYNLNEGQKAAADAFFAFLLTNEKEFIISGPAGVGKTFLMSYIIDNTIPQYLESCKLFNIEPKYNEVVMTATTNKAAEVLGLAVGRPTQTIHSFFNLRVFENHSTGTTELRKTSSWRIHHNLIIFIDECSMIDSELYKALHDGTANCKLVFVGDHNQLAPVHETLSPVYKHNAPMYELTQPMRNASQPALMAICQQLRETVATKQFNPIRLVPGVIDLLDDTQMQSELTSVFCANENSRVLAYTNKRVVEYNDYIRTMRNLPDDFVPGEIVINNSTVRIRQRQLSVEEEVEIIRNHGPDKVEIEPGVFLDISSLDISTRLNGTFQHVSVPTNREHFNQLVKYYSKNKDFKKMFDLKSTYPDFRPRDAATVHKAQGSTYESVFIDLGNISGCNMIDQTARMLYVAFSRAKNRVFLYGNLAEKYGGILQNP